MGVVIVVAAKQHQRRVNDNSRRLLRNNRRFLRRDCLWGDEMSKYTDKLVQIALSQVGVKEEGGNNKGVRIIEYQRATWLPPAPWAWCAALQCWILREWLKDPEVLECFKLTTKAAELWRCKSAGAFDWENWARTKELIILPETAKAREGDFVIFDFSHIGLVIKDQKGMYIETVEGNTNGKGERDSVSGDGVWLKKRHQSLTKCYLRMFK